MTLAKPKFVVLNSIFIFAGDPSADLLGADFVRSLKINYPKIKITGVGGPALIREGLKNVIKHTDLAYYGIWNVLKNTRLISKQVIKIRNALRLYKGDLLITIDMASLSVLLAKDAKKMSLPAYHIVAPTVWAWKSYRAKVFSKLYRAIFCIFPFEEIIFNKIGGKAVFIGHPSTKLITPNYGKRSDDLLLLPGSRKNEVKELLPIFIKAVKLIPLIHRPKRILISSLPQTEITVNEILLSYDLKVTLIPAKDRYIAMQNAKLALVGLGTAGHECVMSAIPQITAYKSDLFTYYFWKLFCKTPFIHVFNYMANKIIIPELLQNNCNPKTISTYIIDYWNISKYRQSQINSSKKLISKMRHNSSYSSGKVVADYISKNFHNLN